MHTYMMNNNHNNRKCKQDWAHLYLIGGRTASDRYLYRMRPTLRPNCVPVASETSINWVITERIHKPLITHPTTLCI